MKTQDLVLAGVLLAVLFVFGFGSPASAVISDVSSLNTAIAAETVDTSMVFNWVGIAIVGMAAIWGVRKLVKTANRT